MNARHALVTGVGLALCTISEASGQLFRILTPLPGGRSFHANALSDSGAFIGGHCNFTGGASRPTLWNPDRTPLALPLLGDADSVYAVSESGEVAAGFSVSPSAEFRAVVWQPGDDLVLGLGRAVGMTPDGAVIVGWLQPAGSILAFSYRRADAVLREYPPADGDTRSQADAIDRTGKVLVGSTGGVRDEQVYSAACVWDIAGGPPTLLDSQGHQSAALAVSEGGHVVVGWASGEVASAAVRWVGGVYEVIIPDALRAVARGVSADGSVVVGTCEGLDGAFVWTAADGARSLRTLASEAGYDMTRVRLWDAHRVSADGRTIVGIGYSQVIDQLIGWEIVLETDCAADFNGNFVLDFFDYLDFAAVFADGDPLADFNGDLQVDAFDYLDFVAAFDAGC